MKNIRRAIDDGEVVVGVCCDISDPSVVEALGYAGWDYVIINAEGGTVSPFGAEVPSEMYFFSALATPAFQLLMC